MTVSPKSMRRSSSSTLFLICFSIVNASCGGAKGTLPPTPGGVPSDAPEWVARGSRVLDGKIVGVGSVSGIANAPLAQDTARNRARAEISRILDVYSASLMKDYQASVSAGDLAASDEGQAVDQAIKTYSANLMSGTEPIDSWLDARSGTWFALVQLDFERAQQTAELRGSMAAWVEQNHERILESLEAETGRAPLASPPSAQARLRPPEGPAVAEAPIADEALPAGPRPGWVDGACERQRYVCGSGEGPDAASAAAAARGELALVFEANVRTVAESFQSAAREASSRTGETWREVERVSDHSMVSSDRLVLMSEIAGRWRSPQGRVWVLAVIDRARAEVALVERIRSLDEVIDAELSRARAAVTPLDRIPVLRRVLARLGERQALEADLRVVRIDGRGLASAVAVEDVLALLAGSAEELRFGLALAGPGAERVRDCLEAALTDAGHRLEAVDVDEGRRRASSMPGGFDVRVEGEIRTESRGRIRGAEVVQTTLTLRLINGRTGRTLRTLTGSQKATRPTREVAASTAATKVCRGRVPLMISEIDRAFGR